MANPPRTVDTTKGTRRFDDFDTHLDRINPGSATYFPGGMRVDHPTEKEAAVLAAHAAALTAKIAEIHDEATDAGVETDRTLAPEVDPALAETLDPEPVIADPTDMPTESPTAAETPVETDTTT